MFISFLSYPLNSQNVDYKFRPLFANPFEGRISSFYQATNSKVRLDIGSYFDLIPIKINDSIHFIVGCDFITLTRLRTESNFKFPVETIDYFFGGYLSGRFLLNKGILDTRIRIAHISAHLADGLAKDSILLRIPYVYSREFFEIILAIVIDEFRFYGGGQYVFSSLPKNIQKLNFELGFDFHKELQSWLIFIIGSDLRLNGYNKHYFATSIIKSGFGFMRNYQKGIFVGLIYVSGKDIHGMYYQENDKYFGIGFEFFVR